MRKNPWHVTRDAKSIFIIETARNHMISKGHRSWGEVFIYRYLGSIPKGVDGIVGYDPFSHRLAMCERYSKKWGT